jgi:hypothetical protein
MADRKDYDYSMKYATLGVKIGMPVGIVLICASAFLLPWRYFYLPMGTMRYGFKGYLIFPIIGAFIGGTLFGLIGLLIDLISDKLKGK